MASCTSACACSTNDFSSVSSSPNPPAAASHTVVGVAEITVLLEKRHAAALTASRPAARRLHLAGEQAKQRRLPGAVAPDDSPALARRDGERDVAKERRRTEFDGDVGDPGSESSLPGVHDMAHWRHSSSAMPIVNPFAPCPT